MSNTNHEKLEKSLYRLKDQYDFFQSNEEPLTKNIEEAIKESIIQRFEVCYDTLWKHLKKHFEEQGLADTPSSPNPIFRISHENGLIENIEDWIGEPNGYSQMRTNTSDDYNMEKAEKALEKIGDFIKDVAEIYQKISE